MKIRVMKQSLYEAVSNVQRGVSAKSSIPALEGILLEAAGSSLSLTGYDLEIGIRTQIEAVVLSPGRLVLNARLFGDMVRRLPEDLVEIECDAKMLTHIVSGKAEFSFLGIAPEDYPELPKIDMAQSVALEKETLKGMIRQTLFAIAQGDAKPVQTGSLFDIGGGELNIVSVDGFRLARRCEKITSNQEINFVVPGKALGEVIKLIDDQKGEVSISVGKRHIMFSVDNFTIVSRLLEGEFLDYKSAVPTEFSTEVTVNTRKLIDGVERVSLLITDRIKSPVRASFQGGELELKCSTAIGNAADQMEVSISGSELEIGFNHRYIIDALRACESDQVRLQLNGPLAPIKIRPMEGDSFLFLVMPVRLKTE